MALLLSLRSCVELNLLDRACKRECSLRLVVAADRRDGISSDFEGLDALSDHRRADGALPSQRSEQLYRRPIVERTPRLEPLGGILQLDDDLAFAKRACACTVLCSKSARL
jgi:hypothetical protein